MWQCDEARRVSHIAPLQRRYAVRELAVSLTRRPDQDTVARRDLNVVALTEAGRVVLWQRPGPFGKQLSGLDRVSLPGSFNAIATHPSTPVVWLAGKSPSGGDGVGLWTRTTQALSRARTSALGTLSRRLPGISPAIGYRDGTVRVFGKNEALFCRHCRDRASMEAPSVKSSVRCIQPRAVPSGRCHSAGNPPRSAVPGAY